MAKQQEKKPLLEREYIVPLRRDWLKVQEYKRATKAIKTIRKFIARHMKLYDFNLRKIRIDPILNNEIRFRGIRKPPAKIKVKAIKYEDYIEVKLVDLPKHIEFELARKAKKKAESEKTKKQTDKTETKKQEDSKLPEDKENKDHEPKKQPDKTETKEKEESSKQAELKLQKQQAKQQKHTTPINKIKEPKIQRKALAK